MLSLEGRLPFLAMIILLVLSAIPASHHATATAIPIAPANPRAGFINPSVTLPLTRRQFGGNGSLETPTVVLPAAIPPSTPSPSGPPNNNNPNQNSTPRLSAALILIPISIFFGIIITVVAVRLSWRWLSIFNRPIVTHSKPVEIVYSGPGGLIQHEVLQVESDRRPGRLPPRVIPRHTTTESLATVYTDSPPRYSTDALTANAGQMGVDR
ncbi:uncharacterized protein SPPG_04484 [Spizellomyces punctatus DAOM BR117]|uniref:Uncharacterized protein n=1 Tax=Spizellomyces punctatus (strain DAOM BR117) TaxID=645134 RepID=A0A0L0HGD4_SPIPD|nr:uncharacterized protein SPPG_04484 [Spizellomyces punctatus DAOM BR117]KND00143.1 hypothetical protein SPPG_04484 [Spizellomyces punctatus DAOM BR117]|eukprot:XP_016608182.1 hypothetical protein SPPG_04484 [Spizellomyces punctatus DAOM BR117]